MSVNPEPPDHRRAVAERNLAAILDAAEHLLERGIVCIVDTTNFHPELGAVVMEEKIKDDVEKTREVWGDYVRPHERLVRSFARRLMEGTVCDELRYHSLVSVRKPGKLERLDSE